MVLHGGCHCGAVRYTASGEPLTTALCHCGDCRRHAGAPAVAWSMFVAEAITITQGETKRYASSEHGRRDFCPHCGTGLFYVNEDMLPGIIDVQTATFDDANAVPPQAQTQVAERIGWMERAHELPSFERFPPFE